MAKIINNINFDDGIEYAVPVERRPPGGVVIRRDPLTGADVFMYKRKPGIYYSGHGTVVASTMARRAGFDVDRDLALLEKESKKAEFERQWEIANRGSDVKTILEYNGYRLDQHPTTGYYVVHVETNDIVTKTHRAKSEQEGLDWLEGFAGPLPKKGFDGTPESVKVADDDIQQSGKPGLRRANRRSRQDAEPAGDVRQPVNS